MIFYEKVKRLCAQKGISISNIGSAIGIPITHGAVTKWSKGAIPRNATVKAIADYFGVTVGYLMGEEEQKKDVGLSDDALKIALFRGADGVTDEMLQEVLIFADFVKAREKNKGKS